MSDSAAVLVVGAGGRLGRALSRAVWPEGLEPVFARRADLDPLNAEALAAALARRRPAVILNAAGWTDVDGAERAPDGARRLNRDLPAALARAASDVGARLVHVSTDYVFDGAKSTPYVESDPTAPLNIYGASKAAGEKDVLGSGARAAVIRTSWVYDAPGSNFLNTMLRLAATRPEISVVSDQHGAPTWAADLASACYATAERLVEGDHAVEGLLHFAGGGEATWATFAEAIFEQAHQRGLPTAKVRRISSAEFQTAAKRPQNSRLDTSRFAQLFGPPRPWHEAVSLCMDEVAALRKA